MSKNKKNNFSEEHQQEMERLKALLETKSNQLKADVEGIKQDFQPIQDVVGSVGKFGSKDSKRKLLYAGVDISMALLTKKIVVTKSNWFNNFALPILVRSLSTEQVETKETGAFDVINSFVKKWLAKKIPALR
jgi:hypothetical protein